MSYIDPYADLRPDPMEDLAEGPSVLIDGRVHRIAPVKTRVYAALLDFAIYRLLLLAVAAYWLVLNRLHEVAGDDAAGAPLTVAVLYYAITFALLGPATVAGRGQSLGKRFLGLRVVAADGGPLELGAAVLRETVLRALPLFVLPLHTLPRPVDVVLILVGLAALATAERVAQHQAPWDRLAGTLVIEHEATPLRVPTPAGPGGPPPG